MLIRDEGNFVVMGTRSKECWRRLKWSRTGGDARLMKQNTACTEITIQCYNANTIVRGLLGEPWHKVLQETQ